MIISFELDKQTIKRTDIERVVSGSVDYIEAEFVDVSGDWKSPVTALFDGYAVNLDDDMKCVVPWEAMQKSGVMPVSAFCGNLHTANNEYVSVEKSGYTEGVSPRPPSPDVYHQLINSVNEAVEVANGVKEDADAGKFDGKAATVTVESTETLPSGSQATVENVGDENDARLAFGIPQGQKGDHGDPFTFDDFTPEQIEELQKPAIDAAAIANTAASSANDSAEKAEASATDADQAAVRADNAAQTALASIGNVLHQEVTSGLVSVHDAWSAPPLGVAVYGASEQAEGTPSPENPIPIDSVTSVTLNVAGKNLIKLPSGQFSGNRDVSWNIGDDGSISLSGVFSESGTTIVRLSSPFVFIAGKTYSISTNYAGRLSKSDMKAVFYDENYTTSYAKITADKSSESFTAQNDFVAVYFAFAGEEGYDATADGIYIQVEVGSTATAYEQSNVTQYPLDLQGNELRSLPGGVRDELDVMSGTLTKRTKKWVGGVDVIGRYVQASGGNLPYVSVGLTGYSSLQEAEEAGYTPYMVVSNNYPSGGQTLAKRGVYATWTNVIVVDDMFTSEEEAKRMLEEEGAEFVYHAKAETVQLDPVEIGDLPAPVFNVWTTANVQNDVAVDYQQDVNIVIDDLKSAIAENAVNIATK